MFFVTYFDGSFITSDQYTDWLQVPDKNKIKAVRVLVNGYTSTLEKNTERGEFFYYKGAMFVINTGQTIPTFEEAGYVYDTNGNCNLVRVTKNGEVQKRKSNIKELKLNLDVFDNVKRFVKV